MCPAHVLRDVQYAIDCGDTMLAPKIREHLRWTIRVGKRRPGLKDSTLAAYAAKAERGPDALAGVPTALPSSPARSPTASAPAGDRASMPGIAP